MNSLPASGNVLMPAQAGAQYVILATTVVWNTLLAMKWMECCDYAELAGRTTD